IMHYSRIMPLTGPRRYFTSTAVFLNEVLKLSISLTMALYEISSQLPATSPATTLFSALTSAVFAGDSWKMAVPALLYTLQNTLQYVAVSNLDAATFQVTYQLKILTTAIFSVMLLGRSLCLRKWLSLLLLMTGVAIVQMPSGRTAPSMESLREESNRLFWPRSIEELRDLGSDTAKQLMRRTTDGLTKRSATYEGIDEDVARLNPQLNASLGLLAVVAACVLSGLAGVYFEKILKESHTQASLWIRNVQLSFYSLFPALFLGVMFNDGEDIAKFGFFIGYSWVVWLAIGMQAIGGVVVALVVSYADNIAKNFATSFSIIMSCFASVWFFNFSITKHYVIGTSIVLFSTWLYSNHDGHGRAGPPPPIAIAGYEKTIPSDDPHVSALFDDLQSYDEFEHPQHLNQRHEPVYTGTDDYADANAYNSNPFVCERLEFAWHRTDSSWADRALLNRAHNDRSRMAQQGRARLSLPPAGGTLGMHDRGPELEHDYREPAPAPPRNIFSQFTYQPSPEQKNDSSDLPSSPALRASQRKQTQPTFSAQWASEEESQQGYISQQPARAPLPKAPVRNAPPTVQGIQLVSTRELPDRFRSIFPFPLFNAIQSKSFETVYNTSDNFVISAPTGSGKTVIFELAILRLIKGLSSGSFKGVYQAPTKALCSERQKDWKKKFEPLGLKVEELTGDTSQDNTREVQTADIIVTTPEKWDSITRKWKDHAKLMQLVKLFLIDEVHMLKEDRGATLEVVVSRMKSIGSEVRFLAVSATVPNFSDIATWLGRNPQNQDQPAAKERFGEEFRPVRLQKHVVGYSNASNEFGFDGFLNTKLPHVVAKYSQRKPIMVFCFTKKSCEESAKRCADSLVDFASSGVAFHHAGLDLPDRQGVEKAYLKGDLSVICSTSTLAVGVNLPCHLVIIKNTVGYTGAGVKEYPDLEIMQMLGRAGRPQFDDSAVAVIMARNEKAKKYEQMVSGQEVLESTLHLNLIEHLNAEISLETINDIYSARRWLSGTFLAVRLEKNPRKYNLQDLFHTSDLDEILDEICNRGISELKNYDFVEGDQKMEVTEYGDIMARYCIRFETMKRFLGLVENRAAKTSEILAALSQAEEFKEVRFRQGDKALYKIINTSTTTKFPIQVNLAQPEHKVSLIIQNELGGGDLPANEDMGKQRISYGQDKHLVFQHARRLLRCIVDCALYREDAKTARNALAFCRSLSSRAWDDMPLTMKLLPSIGIASVRKLVNAGIKSIDEIEYNEPHRLEMILGKNPPAGTKLLATVQDFPKLRVGLRQMPDLKLRDNQAVTVNLRAEVGFVNEKPPTVWNRQPIYICVLSETCDGKMVHFRRISAQKLGQGQQLLFSADITDMNQSINCYIMCDDIAGTMKYATLQPELPAHLQSRLKMNISKRRASNTPINPTAVGDEFDDGGIDDEDLETAARKTAGNDWTDIEEYADSKPSNISTTKKGKSADTNLRKKQAPVLQSDWQPTQLENGKWACNHKCKDKNACKHICCREGVDKPPKPPK
ncbi:nucleotide-sugar transporter-domain-containing protein, partial [Phyllosticta capitalensis]